MKRMMSVPVARLAVILGSFLSALSEMPVRAALPIASLDEQRVIDFETDILPFLRANCLACHNETKSKAGLILETPQSILKGGDSGAAVVAGNPEESLLFIAAAHLDEDVIMPPLGNKSKAANLTPDELARLQLWVLQGAKGEVRRQAELDWQPVAERVQPVYSMAFSDAGRYVAYGRGSEAAIFEVPSRTHVARLVDPALEGDRAHRDLVNAIAFHPSEKWVATGGFREVKLWERRMRVEHFDVAQGSEKALTAVSLSRDGLVIATGYDDGQVRVSSLSTQKLLWTAAIGDQPLVSLFLAPDGGQVLAVDKGHQLRILRHGQDPFKIQRAEGESEIESVAWDEWGRHFAVLTKGGSVRCWGLAPTKEFELRETELAEKATAITIVPGTEPTIAVGFADGGLQLLEIQSGLSVRTFTLPSAVKRIVAAESGDRLLIADGEGTVTLCALEEEDLRPLRGARHEQQQLAVAKRKLELEKGALDQVNAGFKKHADELKKQEERLKKAAEDLAEKQAAESKIKTQVTEAEARHASAVLASKKLDADFAQLEEEKRSASEAVDIARKELRGFVVDHLELASPEGSQEEIEVKLDELLKSLEERAVSMGEIKVKFKESQAALEKKKKAAKDLVDAEKKAVDAEKKREGDAKRATLLARNEKDLAAQSVERIALQMKQDEERKAASALSVEEEGDLVKRAEAALSAARVAFEWIGFSPSGDRVLGYETDGALNVWWAETGEALNLIETGGQGVVSVQALTEDHVLMVRQDGSARLFSLREDWVLKQRFGREAGFADRINALDFSADGKWLAAGGGDPSRSGEILVWDLATMEVAQRYGDVHSDVVFGLRFSPDSRRLASASADRFARILDLEKQNVQHSLEGHTHYVMDVAWQANGRNLVSAGADGMAKIWDGVTGERRKNIEGFKKEVTGVGFVGHSDEIFASGGDTTLAVYGLDGKKRRSMENAPGFLFSESMSGDGRYVAAGGLDGVVRIWELASGKILTTLD